MSKRKVILFIATSIDGYIAREDGNLDWLSTVEVENEDYGYKEFTKSIDTVFMGRKTYEKVLTFGIEFPHKDSRCYVFSRQKQSPEPNVEFYNGNIVKLIEELNMVEGKNIFLDGGANLVNEFIKQDLIDEYIISTVPILLGEGIPLFQQGNPEIRLKLIESKSYPTGLVQTHYQRSY